MVLPQNGQYPSVLSFTLSFTKVRGFGRCYSRVQLKGSASTPQFDWSQVVSRGTPLLLLAGVCSRPFRCVMVVNGLHRFVPHVPHQPHGKSRNERESAERHLLAAAL